MARADRVIRALADEMAASPLDQLAARLVPTVRRRFLEAVQAAQDQVDVGAIAANLAEGHLTTAEALARLDVLQGDLEQLKAPLQQGFLLGAQQASSVLAASGLVIAFDRLNPRSVDWIRQYGGDLITGITDASRQAVRTVLVDSFTQGIPPKATARLIRPIVGLTERQAQSVAAFQQDLLGQGIAEATVATRVDKLAATYARQRGDVIARTETITALNQGQHGLWQEARKQGLLTPDTVRVWRTAEDDRVDLEICEPLDGTEADLDSPFPGGIFAPPAHPNCRCTAMLRFG